MYIPSNDKSKAEAALTERLRGEYESAECQFGADHPDTITRLQYFVDQLLDVWEYEEVEPYQQRLCNALAARLGAEHPETLACRLSLAETWAELLRTAEFEAMTLEVLEASTRVLGPEDPFTIKTLMQYGEGFEDKGDYAQAEALFVRGVESARKILGPDHKTTREYENILSWCQEEMEESKGGKKPAEEPRKKGCLLGFLFHS